MPPDISRRSSNRTKKYSSVVAMQGRMCLESEWNEQAGLQGHRTETETRDVIGMCGTPKGKNGFHLKPTPRGGDLLVGPGNYYVDGMLCELDPERLLVMPGPTASQIIVPSLWFDGRLLATGDWLEVTADQNPSLLITMITSVDATNPASLVLTLQDGIGPYQNAGNLWARRAITYATQPFFPSPPFTFASPAGGSEAVQLSDGDYLVYLRARKREVGALEDPHIREVALGGPDTTAREQIIWQVGLQPISSLASPPSPTPDCSADFPEWDKALAPMTGLMNAQTVAPPPDQNPCALPPKAGYQRLDNQLYRVDVFHGDTTRAASTIVWSRDNASVETNITEVDDTVLTVSDLGKDDLHAFAVNQWVEIVDPEGDLNGSPRFLTQISAPPDPTQSTITIKDSAASYNGRTDLRLRRWDMTGSSVTSQGIPMQAGWMPLESGIQVSFTEGSYARGAYWQVPARTATGDIEWEPYQVPNTNPIPQPPLGGLWHYCKLALIEVRSGMWVVYDCRSQFPALTNICADDICYNSACEDFQSAKTVQQALDEVCHERDLRFHNKHLHGWGVVCGLEVVCGPEGPSGPREHITVKSGYAIDCDGNDVILEKDVEGLNLFDMIPTSPPGSVPNDGDYSLILNSSAAEQFSVTEYKPDSWFNTLFNDSILMDFYNDCIKSFIEIFTGAFTTPSSALGPGNSIVTPAQQRIDTFTNLLSQYSQSDPGTYVYISGYQPNATPPTEDAILREFYNELKKKLQSQTFCAMFDHAREFPSYPFPNLKISSIYGQGFRTNLRVDPSGSRLYTFGTDANIYVYNLSTNQIDSIIQFPSPGSQVQDLAFSSDGTSLYAAAVLPNQETVFAIAQVTSTAAGFQHAWQTPPTIICNIPITRLATYAGDTKNIYAVGAGSGVYRINLAAPGVSLPLAPFCAFGHLVIDSSTHLAYATANSTAPQGTAPSSFDQVLRFDVTKTPPPALPLFPYALPTSGTVSDDIAVVPSSSVANGRLFVTVPSGAGGVQQLLCFDGSTTTPQNPATAISTVNMNETTTLHLAHNPVAKTLMISCLDSHRVKTVSENGTSPAILGYFPTEYMPHDLAFNSATNSTFALNFACNTVSVTPASQAVFSQTDLDNLANYRQGVINAFLDLLAGLLQYLKDCFCDHILVKCPSCDDDDQLFLGTVSIRDGQIYKICNFTKRKYLKSFPTIGYWLSFLPIVPLLHMAVEKFCCWAASEYFSGKKAPAPSAAYAANPVTASYTTKATALQIQGALFTAKNFNPLQTLQNTWSKLSFSKGIFGNFFQSRAQTLPPSAPAISTNAILGQKADLSKSLLEKANVTVDGVVQASPGALPANLVQFLSSPAGLAPNSSATLVTDARGTVIGVIPASKEAQTLQSQLAAMQASHAADLAARDQQIVQLKAGLDQAQTQLKSVSDLQNQVKALASKIGG